MVLGDLVARALNLFGPTWLQVSGTAVALLIVAFHGRSLVGTFRRVGVWGKLGFGFLFVLAALFLTGVIPTIRWGRFTELLTELVDLLTGVVG